MWDFISKRLQKSIEKIKAKTSISENDVDQILREIKLALLEADVNLFVVKDFVNAIKKKVLETEIIGQLNPSQNVIKIVNQELIKILGAKTKPIKFKSKLPILMMVGLQGSGKTTSIVKIAKYLVKKKQCSKPLMIATDIYRPAAIDQLISLGKEINIDVYSNKNAQPEKIVRDGIQKANDENYDLILIDTAGRLSIDKKLMQELQIIKEQFKPDEIFFVVDAFAGQDIVNVVKMFHQKLNLTGLMITKLDSDTRGGAALSISKVLGIPIAFIGNGEKINDITLFHPDRMANRILGMGDVLSLIEKVEEKIDTKKSQKLAYQMISGNFNLDNLMQQLKQMKKLGKLSKLLKLIPGANDKISKSHLDSAERKMKLYQILLFSMTKQERKNPKLLKNSSRKLRIIKGSGRTNQEYNLLINDFERMAKQMKNISKTIKNGTFNPAKMKGINF